MPKQTSIEWLEHKLNSVKPTDFCSIETIKEWLIEAKQMHKEEIEDVHIEGQRVFDKHPHTQWTNDQAEKYYQETYGGNHIVDTNEMIDHIGDANKMVEISDEEIGKGCDENIPLDEADMWSERLYFRIGAQWYREQLKGGNNES